ncbi:MAG: hypothetical protein A2637_07960 [Candidatus Muproteobacteria bacterium RIFCSPHIGHO2_01_FULL_65_16]|uniref:Uncharacterized protein n=1 Tax=Candidatus Muproteobacteria bacterium RIFCSPHIGHO2_01_FULL_65_16 TaxID=1817764 RepID=A0A1F6TLH6_9PROT|nr:MAG: hypothetical protein A2637_07960 [Candidatus Muproteobacteria bacterium RIFCSPHIGHO2_01_FULL_65_16]
MGARVAISEKIFNALTSAIRLAGEVERLSNQVEKMAKEVRDIDSRLIRIETFVEIAQKQRLLPK